MALRVSQEQAVSAAEEFVSSGDNPDASNALMRAYAAAVRDMDALAERYADRSRWVDGDIPLEVFRVLSENHAIISALTNIDMSPSAMAAAPGHAKNNFGMMMGLMAIVREMLMVKIGTQILVARHHAATK